MPHPTPQVTTSPENVPESPDPGSQSSVPHPERAPQPSQSLAPRCVQDQGRGALCDPMAPTHISRPPGPRQSPGGRVCGGFSVWMGRRGTSSQGWSEEATGLETEPGLCFS